MKIQSAMGISGFKVRSEVAQTAVTVPQGTAKSSLDVNPSTTNMLAGNFVHRDAETSRYIQGRLLSLQVRNDFSTKIQGLVGNYQLQISAGDAESYAQRTLAGKKAANAVEKLIDEAVTDSETARLEQERQDSTDEAAQQVEETTAENSGRTVTEVPEETAASSVTQIGTDGSPAVESLSQTAALPTPDPSTSIPSTSAMIETGTADSATATQVQEASQLSHIDVYI